MARAVDLVRLKSLAIAPPVVGLVAVGGGLALLATHGVTLAALGVESIALAFWLWSRAAADRREQLPRWAWLRRPAMALWLAAALGAALPAPRLAPPPVERTGLAVMLETPDLSPPAPAASRDPLAPLRVLQALAVLWAGLELLGALPLSRPFPDVTGPLPHAGPWLPAMLPAAGFLVLWRQAPLWTAAPLMREIAVVALVLGAALAVLRAYTRRTWTASLRWLAVFDSSLAALLVALDIATPEVACLLWFAAAGGRLMALAGELHGASNRRGPTLALLWRLAGFSASASLAWLLLASVAFSGGRFRPFEYIVIAAPVFLALALSLRRVVEAPERRAIARADIARIGSMVAAVAAAVLGPAALVLAWWAGFQSTLVPSLLALAPALLAFWPRSAPRAASEAADPVTEGAAADVAALPPVLRASIAAGATARDFAQAVFRFVTSFERQLAGVLGALLRALGAPARDLHTGDAQEYLLFLVGVGVLALLLPLLLR